MSLLAEFDPLVSPVNKTPESASAPAAAALPVAAASPSKQKFDGTNVDFLYSAKWRSLRASATHSYTLAFSAPKPKIVSHDEDPVARIVAEREAKAKADAERAEQEREQEKQRQQEAIAAAAAGKEEIGADVKKVDLPDMPPASSSVSPPVDSSIAKAAAAMEKLNQEQEKANAALNRYAEKSTFRYTSSEDSKDMDPPVVSQVEYIGAFSLQNQNSIVLTDLSKTTTKAGAAPVKSDVSGSFTLSITPDGKKVTGKIEGDELDFELLDSSADLTAILGY